MKFRKYFKTTIFLLVILLVLLSSSCYRWDIYTIEWEVNGSFRQFATTDRENHDTMFFWWDDTSLQSPTMIIPVEAEMKRISGYENAPYGVVFCVQDTGNFYMLWITVNQRYAIVRSVNGNLNYEKFWSYSSDLVAGYDAINNVKIEYDDLANEFSIYFNGVPSGSFVDSSFSGGYSGYCVRVSSNEYEILPQIPVDVRFRLIDPIVDP